MADQTATLLKVNQVLPSLSLTTTEKEYEFTNPDGKAIYRAVIVNCTADFEWANDAAGPYFPIPAFPNGYEYDLPRGATSIWFRTLAGTGTLSAVVSR